MRGSHTTNHLNCLRGEVCLLGEGGVSSLECENYILVDMKTARLEPSCYRY